MLAKNKPSLLVTIGAIAILIGGGVAAYFVLTARRTIRDVPLGANIVPQDALLAVSVSTSPQKWQTLQQYGTSQSQAAFEQLLIQWRDRIFTDQGYDFEQDIQPWIGNEVMMAWLPDPALVSGQPSPSGDTPRQSPMTSARILLLPIANPLRAQEILTARKSLNQGEILERNYRGIDIFETQGRLQNYSIAVLDREFLLVSDDPRATDRAIDTYRGDTSLAATPGYSAAVQQIRNSQAFAQVYLNIPVAASLASMTAAQPIPPESLEQLKRHQGFATTAILRDNGINFQGVSWLRPNTDRKLTVGNSTDGMLRRIPDTAIMTLGGSNLKQFWSDYNQGANANPIAPFNPQALAASLQESIGMELQRDFLSWMDGEFSLSVIPAISNPDTPQRFMAGLIFMIRVSDRNAADTALQQLDEILRGRSFQVGDAQLNGQPVVQWTSPYGGFTVLRGWLDGDVAFVNLGAAVANQIIPQPQTAISSSSLFRQTFPSSLSPKHGNFYINVEQVFNRQNLSLPPLPPQQEVWVNAVQSIGLTTAVTDNHTSRYDLFVNLKSAAVSTDAQEN
ncbi:DUF3352 domain-containing protein [Arthrospira platensis]|jgi:hypothetical protein|uniref:DUF3352 domain-containing protein n=1 Tax=Limnospira platensis NIES-46 TaxID=1236695 RepID=A0A5M3T811_LIMPL|nr:DUF3352 domain-containing protein [Arthrospira platensis]AMW31043.1 hypothetical protein AP285_27095 [Arthrospira platensis YZ]KDR54824.1 hypothetical protein APPUASWS_026875 [Arthrospira platensis str. Paraca]MBD2670463.1 DUF3352 domain-containing protein [Arthrospira platensis FACHB-439]MBD2711217.1 DUF3352 domain-containing protein [Arthrospira platensis FACHB-835]MDT9182875.1 DUF3352 domain-containing protein [Limnospira sp. PMC 289.06]MDT9311447.1 DUF3352 domain-containing protein [Li